MRRIVFLAVVLWLASFSLSAADWLTDGGDIQRTGWQKDEKILNISNVKGLKLLWKVRTASQPPPNITGGFNLGRNLLPPLIIERVDTAAGAKEIALVRTVFDHMYAIDVASGDLLWGKQFDRAQLVGSCQVNSTPVIVRGASPGKYTVHALSFDGKLHQLNLADGQEIAPAEPFLPPNSRAFALTFANGVTYTMTGGNCGGHANYVYVYDHATRITGAFSPGSGAMWGTRGGAMGADGTLYVGTADGQYDPANGLYGNSIVGVKQNRQTKALELAKYFAPSNVDYLYKRDLDMNVTSTIFNYKGKEYLAASSKECRVWLLDTADFGGANHQTPVYRTPLICNEFSNYFSAGVWGALSSWVDPQGTSWVLVPFWGPKHSQFKAATQYGPVTKGGVAAFKVEERNGKVELIPAWVSQDIGQPGPVVIANGIVFAYRTGADTTIGRDDTPLGATPQAPTRLEASTHAILYAFDAQTGKELWSSGTEINSFNHQSGITVANGKVYIGTYDGVQYCFGLNQ